jgi:transcriptional regulator with XRE-family HTH domain
MSYRLKMARIDSIHSLYQQGWSQRRIARELDLNRETVARYLKGDPESSKPANAPIGSQSEGDNSKPASAPIGSDRESNPPPGKTDSPISPPNRASGCEPWRAVIRAKIELGLSAQRIYQDLITEHGYHGTYYGFWTIVS